MNETWFLTIIMSLVGACFGSFSSVLIERLYKDEGEIICGRSHCCHTGKPLAWWELIPIFSWLLLGGKSRHTGQRIPVFYLLLEIGFAAVFGIFTWQKSADFLNGNFWEIFPLFLMLFLTLVLFFYDARYMIVDRRISWPAIFLALLWGLFRSFAPTFDESIFREFLLGGAIGFGFYFAQHILSKGTWVGAGDQELGLFMGLLLGWPHILLAGFLAYLIGMVYAIAYLYFVPGSDRKTPLPMGAFLMPALLLFLYDTALWWNVYEQIFGRI
jgi:prepilin signal peptidase PulO-like enzyme (type II secretory pathway)